MKHASRLVRRIAVALAIALASLTLGVAVGCSQLPVQTGGTSPATLAGHRGAVDFEKAGAEATEVLRGYLQIDTQNPPGNETKGAKYLAGILAKEGIPSEIVGDDPERGSLIARLEGTGSEKPLCLVSHIDVVGAEEGTWRKGMGPFSGVVDDKGALVGRGALDMKGLGALEVMTMVLLKRHHVPLKRSIILLAVADEEVASRGMKYVVARKWAEIGCSHAINEGGLGVRDAIFEGQTVFAIGVADKGALWARMVAQGEAGHGSSARGGTAPERLMAALAALQKRDVDVRWHPAVLQMLAQAGHQKGGMTGFVLSRPALAKMFAKGQLMANGSSRGSLTNTVTVTGFSGGTAPNVVPSEVSATLDCRLLPGVSPDALLKELKDLVNDEHVRFDVIYAEAGNESAWEGDPFFDALLRHLTDGRPDIAAGPWVSPGYTDSISLRPLGVRAYGIVPFEVSLDEAKTFHGKDERVPLASVTRGLRVLYRAVVDVSAAPIR